MQHLLFVAILALLLMLTLRWGFKHLPDEKWQILASVPRIKHDGASWAGINFTFYGFFSACAYTFASAILILLLESAGVSLTRLILLIVCVLGICVPASKVIARIVEKKSATFTVSGASFIGIAVTPFIIIAINAASKTFTGFSMPVMTIMAALSTAYAFGEGIGRLACISFGCCYGRRLSECPSWVQRLMGGACFVFSGKTKKIAYSHGLDGQKVLPVQAATSLIFCTIGLIGLYLFLEGYDTAAFILTVCITQIWRFVSELFRADYRGEGDISVYQILSLISVGLAIVYGILFPAARPPVTDIAAGLAAMWNPAVIILLQSIFAAIFIYTGKSRVTASILTFHVVQDRI